MTKIRAEILISGEVQMVGFRSFTARHASALGLKGYVKNLDDGRVEVVVEGVESRVEDLVLLLREGPHMTRVTDVQVMEKPYTGEFDRFDIRF
ncbi:MAG: acylphosphatase [Methanosarcinales archaeon]|nr:MAG: acylphosphatase [Methanosarcinales archaeon]